MKILTWPAAGRLLGSLSGFFGFYVTTLVAFPPGNEVDSMMLVLPFFLGACVMAILGGWIGGRLFGQIGCIRQRRRPDT